MEGGILAAQMLFGGDTSGGSGGGCVMEMNPNSNIHMQPPPSLHQVYRYNTQQEPAPLLTHLQNLATTSSKECLESSTVMPSYGKMQSDQEDDPSFNEESEKGKKSSSPSSTWHRVKWSDKMVKLLISVVIRMGGEEGDNMMADANKRKSLAHAHAQKKGKWKSISQAMMERGCLVSPQQCEDKFNDLNKRYKRLNDILGKGISCSVVENPSLLDTVETISTKAKEDVKKLLSSKHLFYKEMCSYHSGCKALVTMSDLDNFQVPANANAGNNRDCRDNNIIVESVTATATAATMKGSEEEDYFDEEEEEEEEDEEDEEPGMEGEEGQLLGKRSKIHGSFTGKGQLMRLLLQNGSSVADESRNWLLQVEEQKLQVQVQSLELERERFRWQRFNLRKEKELERARLTNEKVKLENEEIALQLKKKELDIECKRSEASMASFALILERLQSKEQITVELGTHDQ